MKADLASRPALPGVTRNSTAGEPATPTDAVDQKQRKRTAWVLGGIATAFLSAGAMVNPAFLVIGGFLGFATFLITRPPTVDRTLSIEITPVVSFPETSKFRDLLPGTPEYEIRHGSMKWD